MFTRSATRLLSTQTRAFSTSSARQTKVAVLGAGGGIGQPLSLLLKIDPLVSSLSLYDIRGAPGVAADVSHIDSDGSVCCPVLHPRYTYQHRLAPTCQVKGYTADQLDEALEGAKVVVIPAGVPRKV
jgi:malate dehydrogenase